MGTETDAYRVNSSLLDTAISVTTAPGAYRHAAAVIDEVVIYDAATLADNSDGAGAALLAELADVLDTGPGVFVVRGAVPHEVLDPVTAAFERMIAEQRAAGRQSGDHFARTGSNDRVWNALEKLARREPELFVDYYACSALRLASLAWLGPGYQVTSQLNVVNPGGEAQNPHCDYHLGFMSTEQAAAYPARVHAMSRMLTLQGAIAHCDMPIATGPTMLLPHSQKYRDGYLCSARPEIAAMFRDRQVQIPLMAGDAMFFNPALIHGAGTNVTADVRRMANLLQVSSAFGRAMESVDRRAICASIFPALSARTREGWAPHRIEQVIAAGAEGYAFPTNLDLDPPIGGLAPPSQADLLRSAVREQLTLHAFNEQLDDHERRRGTSSTSPQPT